MAPMIMYKRKQYRKKPTYRKRKGAIYKRRSYARNHGVKSFVATFKYMDVTSSPLGTHVDKFSRFNLGVTFNSLNIVNELSALYKQFAITGIQYKYVPDNSSPQQTTSDAATILFCEDKATAGNLTAANIQSQDNCRTLTTARPWKHYVRLPKPLLFQDNGLGAGVQVQTGSRFVTWLSTRSNTDKSLLHLSAHMCVGDSDNLNSVFQGELWCKVYVKVKEQSSV